VSLTSTMIAISVAGYLLGVLSLWPVTRRLATDLHEARTALLHDRLTGLRNRDGLAADHHTLTRDSDTLATLLIDIDNFKTVNDTHGHHTGDHLLTAVAARLGELARLYHGTAARLGGDEFAVLVPAAGTDPARVADTIHTVTSQPVTTPAGSALAVMVSVGYTTYSTNLTTALRAADIAMYHAKQSRTGRPVQHRPGMTVPARHPHQRRHLRDGGATR
jgi:diguanylate cyclase (GGDEF)-like protein